MVLCRKREKTITNNPWWYSVVRVLLITLHFFLLSAIFHSNPYLSHKGGQTLRYVVAKVIHSDDIPKARIVDTSYKDRSMD